MEEELTKELRRILAAIKIVAPDSVRFGAEVTSLSLQGDARTSMVETLGQLLYLQCYSRRFSGEIDQREIALNADDSFVKRLSDANSSREYLNRGWHVIQKLPTGHFVAEKNGLTRVLFAGEFISHSDLRSPVEVGTPISIF